MYSKKVFLGYLNHLFNRMEDFLSDIDNCDTALQKHDVASSMAKV